MLLAQDSIVGTAVPRELANLYRDLQSPYCPGLSLASCPSPQADSLRKDIAVRLANGESVSAITDSLAVAYGSNIRGSPTLDGFGAAAYAGPAVLVIIGAFMIRRWLRRNVARSATRSAASVLLAAGALGTSLGACTTQDATPERASPSADSPTTPYVGNAWARPAEAGAVAGGYLTLHNPTETAVRLVRVASPLADTVEVHETVIVNGMARMQPRPALEIGARDSVVLRPGGLHLMLMRVSQALSPGDTVPLSVTLSDGNIVDVRAEVRSADGQPRTPTGDASHDHSASLAPDSGTVPLTAEDSVVAAILACPRDGQWHLCSLERRLVEAGVVPHTSDDTIGLKSVSQPGLRWRVGRLDLMVFLFADRADVAQAFASLDSARAAPRGDSSVTWPAPPTLVRNQNVMVILLGGSPRQVERVTNAVLAGPPTARS